MVCVPFAIAPYNGGVVAAAGCVDERHRDLLANGGDSDAYVSGGHLTHTIQRQARHTLESLALLVPDTYASGVLTRCIYLTHTIQRQARHTLKSLALLIPDTYASGTVSHSNVDRDGPRTDACSIAPT